MYSFSSILNALSDLITKPESDFFICSVRFWALFVVFYLIYIFVRKSTQKLMMAYVIVFGLFIAYKANGWAVLLLPTSVLVSWYLTEVMKKAEKKSLTKMWLVIIILIDLAPLVLFKYSNFIIGSINEMFQTNFSFLSLILPIGISFYTFQAISYSVDVYKNKLTYDVTLLEYFFYISFFPLLFSGPITRTDTLVPQIRQRTVDEKLVNMGMWLIVLGLIKKGLIADYLAQFNNMVFESTQSYSGFEVLMGALGFNMQIYCDFSGYSDMAIGLAAIMGFRLLPNFNSPYKSLNASEFWRRWHIALSTWFRDYLYIPMGGNRKGKFRTYLNNFITMVVAGLWHGASWMFVIWGAMHGLALVIHKACKSLFLDKIKDNAFTKFVWWTITFVFISVTWIYFRAGMLSEGGMETTSLIFSKLFNDFDWAYLPVFVNVRFMWTLFLVLAFVFHFTPDKWCEKIKTGFADSPWIVKLVVFALVVQLIINFNQENVQQNLYAQF